MRFLKMNGLGNAFALFDRRGAGAPLILSETQVRAVADQAGADQVIALEDTERGDVFMRIWNANGEEVSACGNATRCAAWLVMEARGTDHADIVTAAGELASTRAGERMVTVDMGPPKLDWAEIPLAEPMATGAVDIKVGPIDAPILHSPGAVNMGNPHCVFFVKSFEGFEVEKVGPMIEHHPLFPERANVGFARVDARDRMRLRVWERGAGLTLACGTGACAALVAAHRRRLTDRSATLSLDGGDIQIAWRETDDHVLMTGPIAFDGEGAFAL
ncbi:MAG: diaminopimelate epimerase [Maricaulaceae bacterium]